MTGALANTLAVAGALTVLVSQAASACNTAPKPRGQSIVRFYDKEGYGQLGVKGLGQHVHILDEYRCYDLSFLRNKNLSIYFNNIGAAGDASPTFVGAIIVRSFSGKEYKDGPFSGYLYRNESSNDSLWVRPKKDVPALEPDSVRSADEIEKFLTKYESEVLRAGSLTDLSKLLQSTTSPPDGALTKWHAWVAAPEQDRLQILRNTASTNSAWRINPAVADGAGDRYFLLKAYLVKYRRSTGPTAKPFFESGATSADCVYIKLIAPGDGVSTFALRNVGSSGDFITLKMKSNARCFSPG